MFFDDVSKERVVGVDIMGKVGLFIRCFDESIGCKDKAVVRARDDLLVLGFGEGFGVRDLRYYFNKANCVGAISPVFARKKVELFFRRFGDKVEQFILLCRSKGLVSDDLGFDDLGFVGLRKALEKLGV